MSAENLGYDVESAIPNSGLLRFIEVKGRARGAKFVTITKNEILTGLNKPEDFILALVILDPDREMVRYVRDTIRERAGLPSDERQLRPG